MPTFRKDDDKELAVIADTLMAQFETHKPLIEAKVKIDFMYAFADVNENGEPIGNALTKNGIKALGITRKLSLKDRAKGLGDAEIVLDGDWWGEASPEEQRALLDHELHHIAVVEGRRDDLGRPVIKLRKHDLEVGWFAVIAQRHGVHAIERQQAKKALDLYGQYFWPEVVEAMGQTRFASIAEISVSDKYKQNVEAALVQDALKKTPEFKALAEAVRNGELTITTKPN